MATVREIGGVRVLFVESGDAIIDSERGATDLIGDAFAEGVRVIAVPSHRFSPDFFQLRSGLAGTIAQKVVNYRLTLAVLGEIEEYLAASNALRDWVREANRGDDLWFLANTEELVDRLASRWTDRG